MFRHIDRQILLRKMNFAEKMTKAELELIKIKEPVPRISHTSLIRTSSQFGSNGTTPVTCTGYHWAAGFASRTL